MKLLELYSLATGLKIRAQHLLEQFFPLPFSEYIVLHGSAGMAGKQYPLYGVVIELIKPYLTARGIEIVQIGTKDDSAVPGCYHVMGKENPHQASYLIRGCKLLLCNDSVWAHRAGHLNVPIVELFGPTSESNHSPYQYNEDKTIFLSSHRWGRNPTFASQENPMSIALIDPYDVARAVLKLLDIPHTLTQRTIHVGPAYHSALLEWIPNLPVNPQFSPEASLVARYDLCANESALVQTLQTGRKINLLTKTAMNLQMLAAFKGSILTYGHEVNESTSPDYVAAIRKIFPAATFFTRTTDHNKLAALRFALFDVVQIQHVEEKTRADFEGACWEYTNDPAFSLDYADKSRRLEFMSNKHVLSNGKVYLSHAHEKADIPLGSEGANLARNEDVWTHDINHWLVYLT